MKEACTHCGSTQTKIVAAKEVQEQDVVQMIMAKLAVPRAPSRYAKHRHDHTGMRYAKASSVN